MAKQKKEEKNVKDSLTEETVTQADGTVGVMEVIKQPKRKTDPRLAAFLASDIVKQIAKDSKERGGLEAFIAADKNKVLPRIPSGVFMLDCALGGGWQAGMIHTLYGPQSGGKTTLILRTIAEGQKLCANCYTGSYETQKCECKDFREFMAAFIDVEGTLDLGWAEKLGVDLTRLVHTKPTHAEQALDVLEAYLRGGAFDAIAFDSLAFATPAKEISAGTGAETMGAQARVIGKGIRKVVSALNDMERGDIRRRPTIFFTNQVRMKIGVMFGCFHYNARVSLADGTSEKIGKIVNQKMDIEVLSYNKKTGAVEPKRIKNWFNNGIAEEGFLQLVAEKAGGNGRSQFGVTANHIIMTPHGEKRVSELNPGDKVLGIGQRIISEQLKQIVLGSILGDGSIRKIGEHTTQLRIGHGKEQIDYCRWKQSLFGDAVGYSGFNPQGGWSFDLHPSIDLNYMAEACYEKDLLDNNKVYRNIPKSLINDIDLLGIAIWYMDDGSLSGSHERWGNGRITISAKSYTDAQLEPLIKKMELLGIPRPYNRLGVLQWSGKDSEAFQSLICKYIHPSMNYKLANKFKNKYIPPVLEDAPTQYDTVELTIVDIYEKPTTEGSPYKFDLEIDGNHSYVVDSIIVHNSPETVSAGNAPRFAASTEVRLSAGKYEIPEGGLGKPTSVEFNFKVEKNKSAVAKISGEYTMCLSSVENKKLSDIMNEYDMSKIAEKLGLLTGGGSSYEYDGIKYKGKAGFEHELMYNPTLYSKVYKDVMKAFIDA